MDTSLLVKNALLYNEAAQAELFRRYSKPLMRLCLKHLKNEGDARDVMVGSFQSFFKNLHRYQDAGEGSLFKWLAGFANMYQLKQRDNKMHWRQIEEPDLGVPADPQHVLEQKMDGALLMRFVLKQQGNIYIMVFILITIMDWNHHEISERLQIGKTTSRKYLQRGKQALMEKLIHHKNSFYEY